ncbi:MAG: hypothetical protein WA943_10010 [Parvibaculum sp.]|uniref:hypothetical protein n=1 Tax=Parvibaculum sp. TaxID=2024848 RepID=UPI003C71CFC2
MGTRVAARMSARTMGRRYTSPENLSQRCLLCIVGVLASFMALVHGMIAVQGLSVTTPQELSTYWLVAALGVWVPAIALFASIVGIVIRDKMAMSLLLLSPLASIGGYCLYTYGPTVNFF